MRRELRALFYGSGQAGEGHHGDGDDALPESLVLWLSERYVGGPELQASLAALELAILSDVSQQLERSRGQALLDAQAQAQSVSETVRQTVSHSVQHSATAQGLSEEVRARLHYRGWGGTSQWLKLIFLFFESGTMFWCIRNVMPRQMELFTSNNLVC